MFSKFATEWIPVAQITAAHFLLQSLFMCQRLSSREIFSRAHSALAQAFLSAVFLILSTFFFITAISIIPFADAFAIVSIKPFIIFLFGKFVLGETVIVRLLRVCPIAFEGVFTCHATKFKAFDYIAFLPVIEAFSFTF